MNHNKYRTIIWYYIQHQSTKHQQNRSRHRSRASRNPCHAIYVVVVSRTPIFSPTTSSSQSVPYVPFVQTIRHPSIVEPSNVDIASRPLNALDPVCHHEPPEPEPAPSVIVVVDLVPLAEQPCPGPERPPPTRESSNRPPNPGVPRPID